MKRYSFSVPPPPGDPGPWDLTLGERTRALEQAADLAVLAPSVHNTQPWRIELRDDGMTIRADRSRQLPVLDPQGRDLALSVGAALFNVRAALAARGLAVEVSRLPDPVDPDLLAVADLVAGARDTGLAALAPAIPHRRTNRRTYDDEPLPEAILRRLTDAAAAEDTLLVPVMTPAQRAAVARLAQQADAMQNADPAYRAELRNWTTRRRQQGDGVPGAAVPHVDGGEHDEVPLRDFDTQGTGALPPGSRSGSSQTLVLLATGRDDQRAWLRCGEALQRILLELTQLGLVASPLTQVVEVPLTRTQLRSALTWDAHPQMLLRIGAAAPTAPTPRRPRTDVVGGSRRPPEAPPPPTTRARTQAAHVAHPPPGRPVTDGRGGTTWV
jgi:nitroreductase